MEERNSRGEGCTYVKMGREWEVRMGREVGSNNGKRCKKGKAKPRGEGIRNGKGNGK